MARTIRTEPSRTLMEYRLLPSLTTPESSFDRIDLSTWLVSPPGGGPSRVRLGLPLTASAMQAVSGVRLAAELSRLGGLAFIFCSQPVAEQAAMVRQVKEQAAAPRLLVGAAINTHDFEDRVAALAEAGVDVVAVDSSDGHSFYQGRVLDWLAAHHPQLPVIGGNVITGEGFDYLVEHGAWAAKVGMGGGSICITQEQKGTGRGLATSVIEVAAARDRHRQRTGRHVPLIADGGIGTAKEIAIALALGADCVMMGRYFAGCEESPTEQVTVDGRPMKPYWGEGSARAREWKAARYHQSLFEEGVEGLVDCSGPLAEQVARSAAQLRSTLSSCGCPTIREFQERSELEVVSALAIREGQVHDIVMPGSGPTAPGRAL